MFWQVLNEKIFQNENITKVFHNAMYDVCWIRAVTGMMIKGRIVDTMIAASVIDEKTYTDEVTKWIDEGATILAGCCRTRPSHIKEMTERLSKK